ncbi:MAG: Uma2 family endonuclease [Nostocales cyanobacterium ELA583]|jgi:Uma2 family endonuclease
MNKLVIKGDKQVKIAIAQVLLTDEFIVGLLGYKFLVELARLNLFYIIPKNAFVKPPTAESAYSPDILLLNPSNLVNESLWEKQSTLTNPQSVPLVVEVVSTNWGVDYGNKVDDYEAMGIPEYWIVDYLGLGGRRFIGSPKLPTLSIYSLVDNEYQVNQFRGDDVIVSPTFPGLSLTAKEVLQNQ